MNYGLILEYFEDIALVARVLDDKTREKAFRELVEAYHAKLYWLVRGIVGNHDDADDVLQNTFIKIARHLHSYRGQAALLTWMYKIACNECATFIASAKQFRLHVRNDASFPDRAASESIAEEKVMACLDQGIQSLPEKQRIVFCLRYFDGMPYEQMAIMTETSVGALKASYHHAVKKIEEVIKNGEFTF